MKIATALAKLQGVQRVVTIKQRLTSESAGMRQQDAESLVFWLILDSDSDEKEKVKTLKKILAATDWKLHK